MKNSTLEVIIFACCILHFALSAETPKPSYVKNVESTSFFPGVADFHVDLAIPDDFITSSKNGSLDLDEGIFWGNKETLERYFAGELPLQSCIVAVRNSDAVIQDGPQDFSANVSVKKEWKKLGSAQMKITKGWWGKYPLLMLESAALGGTHYYLAWVGLNREDGKTMMFTFLCPNEMNKATDLELAIWYYFLQKTKDIQK